MAIRIAIPVLAVVTFSPVIADDEASLTFRIDVEVTVADDDLRKRVSAYLTSELQALRDVEITSENPDYKLYAMVMQVRTSEDLRMAYVLDVSVATFFPDGYFDSILRDDLGNAEEIRRKLEGVTVYRNRFLSLAGPSEANLQEVSRNVVSKINYHLLSPGRAAGPVVDK